MLLLKMTQSVAYLHSSSLSHLKNRGPFTEPATPVAFHTTIVKAPAFIPIMPDYRDLRARTLIGRMVDNEELPRPFATSNVFDIAILRYRRARSGRSGRRGRGLCL